MLHKVSWINIQLALADGARIKDRDGKEKGKDSKGKTGKMTQEELREFFNNRNALKRR